MLNYISSLWGCFCCSLVLSCSSHQMVTCSKTGIIKPLSYSSESETTSSVSPEWRRIWSKTSDRPRVSSWFWNTANIWIYKYICVRTLCTIRTSIKTRAEKLITQNDVSGHKRLRDDRQGNMSAFDLFLFHLFFICSLFNVNRPIRTISVLHTVYLLTPSQ